MFVGSRVFWFVLFNPLCNVVVAYYCLDSLWNLGIFFSGSVFPGSISLVVCFGVLGVLLLKFFRATLLIFCVYFRCCYFCYSILYALVRSFIFHCCVSELIVDC